MKLAAFRFHLLTTLLPAVLSCSESSPVEPTTHVGRVEVATASFVVGVGQTEQLTATVRDDAGNVLPDFPGTWTSSHPEIAVVDSTGLVRGISSGLVSVGFEADGKTGGVNMDVWEVSVSLSPDSLILETPGTEGGLLAMITERREGPISAVTPDFIVTDTTVATLRRCSAQCTGTTRGQTVFLTPRKSGTTRVIASFLGVVDTGMVHVRLP